MARRGGRHRAPALVTSTSSPLEIEQVSRSATRERTRARNPFKTLAVVSVAGALSFTMAVPAYAASPEDQALASFSDPAAVQVLDVSTSDETVALVREAVASKKTAVKRTLAATATETNTANDTTVGDASDSGDTDTRKIPNGVGSAGLLAAAMAQLGDYQDCTAMVERALRAIGYKVGNLGPMGFGQYGKRIKPSEAGPGDIMMRPGHVAIYAGNGKAVHGGYMGTTRYVGGAVSNPYNYTIIIRVGG